MLKIRLRRMGSRHSPFYRVVVSDSRRVPTASAIEEIGYYDPRANPSLFKVDLEKLDGWVAKGAQPSETVSKLAKKARRAAQLGDDAESPPADVKAAKAPAKAPAEPAAESEPAAEAVEATDAPAEEASEATAEAPAAEAEAASEETKGEA